MKKSCLLFIIAVLLSSCAPFNETDISGISIAPPSVPTNVQADSDAYGIRLTWNSVENADYYRVYYGTNSETFSGYYETYSSSYFDSNVWPGDTWYYFVASVQGGVVSDFSYTVYGQRVLTSGRWSDVTGYGIGEDNELSYESSGSSTRSCYVHFSSTDEYYLAWFPVTGGNSYSVKVYDSTRNSSVFGSDNSPAKVSVYVFPAGSSSSDWITCSDSTTALKAQLTGYYMVYIKPSTTGYCYVDVD